MRQSRHSARAWKRCILVAMLAAGLIPDNYKPAAAESSASRNPSRGGAFPEGKFDPAISPNGSQVAYAWNGENHQNYGIYVERVGSQTPRRLTHNPGAEFGPAWSPDGRYIAFCRQGPRGAQILTIPAAGGAERRLGASVASHPRLAWAPNGKLLAAVDTIEGLPSILMLSTESGEKHRLTTPPTEASGDDYPALSPDGRNLAFVRTWKSGAAEIYLQPLADLAMPSGPARRLSTAFEPTAGKQGIHGLGWTADGASLIFSSGGLWKVSAAGGPCSRLASDEDGEIRALSVARQGRRVAYAVFAPEMELWRTAGPGANPEEFPPTRLSVFLEETGDPTVSRDGKQLTLCSFRSGSWEIWKSDKDGKHLLQLSFLGNVPTGSPRWSPDGKYVVFDARAEDGFLNDIYVVSANGGTARRLTKDPSADIRPCYSSDQRWIYFTSNRSGTFQIWKMPADGGVAVQVTRGGGFVAFESLDGKFLYYGKSREDHSLWRVPVGGGEETKVLDHVDPSNFVLCNLGICILNADAKPRPEIEFYDFATQKRIRLNVLPKEGAIWPGGTALGVSPDGRWLVFMQEGVIAGHLRTLDY